MSRSRRATGLLTQETGEGRAESQWVEGGPEHMKELSNRVSELSILMGISTLLSSDRPLPESLESVCRLSTEICKAQVSFIYLADGEDDLVCIARHTPIDALQYAWEGIGRIYGRKSIQKDELISCSNLLLRREGQQQEPNNPRMGGICAIPLKGRARIVGAMVVGYPDTHRCAAREKDMLRAVSAQVAMAVERSWLFDQLQEQLARANSLREAIAHIGSSLELDTVVDSVVSYASRLLAAEFSAVFLLDYPNQGRPATQGRGGERWRVQGCTVQMEDGPMGTAVQRAVETGRPAIVQSPAPQAISKPTSEIKPADCRAALAVPLLLRHEVLGALVTCYLERRRFDPSDISLAEDFAGQAAIAIQNARIYEDAQAGRLGLEAALDQINNHGISLLGDDLGIRFANPATFWLLGVGPTRGEMALEEWTALAKRGLLEGSELDQVVEQMRANPEETLVAELTAKGPGEASRAITLLSLPLRRADGAIKGRVNVLEEKKK